MSSASTINLATLQSLARKPDGGQSPNGYPKDTSLCTNSTPHAPRYPKSFLLGSHSAFKLKRSYKYLNNDGPKSLSTADLDKQKLKRDRSKPSEAEVLLDSNVSKPTIVQPFRRTIGIKAPDCVPLLDLRRFNEPDEDMYPIELVSFPHPMIVDTERTDISWGTSRVTPNVTSKSQEPRVAKGDSNIVGCVEAEKNDNGEDEVVAICDDEGKEDNVKPVVHNDAHLKYVESRVVSQERGREEYCHPTQHPPEQTKPEKAPYLLNEKALTKRIRFSARVLTQNGRDIHRELCGFFFLADGSLTVYEFRQFGQRVSALPLIPRGIYRRPIGKRTGETYEIRHIKKGATLYFDSASLSSLPENFKRRPVIGIRVSDVDEEAKFSQMKRDLNPAQYSQVDSYLCQSPSEESKRQSRLLKTLQGMLRNRLRGRGSQVLVGLGRYLRQQCSSEGLIDKIVLQQGMRAYHISLTPEDYDQLWELLLEEHSFDLTHKKSELQEYVWLDRIIAGLIGEMNEERKMIVRKVFLKMDSTKSGSVKMSEMQKHFSPLSHPDVVSKKITAEELLHGLFGCLQPPFGVGTKGMSGCITYADFEHYYEGLSIETKSDSDFVKMMMKSWSV